MSKYSKEPSFVVTGIDQPITKVAMPIIAVKGNMKVCMGTAVMLTRHLAITACH
jgi:hypothetical protein